MIFAAPVASLQMEELHVGVPLLWSKQEELKNPDRIEKNSVTIGRIELQRRRNQKNGKNRKIQEWFNCHHVVLLSNLSSPLYSRRRSYKAITWAWPRPTLPTMTAHRARYIAPSMKSSLTPSWSFWKTATTIMVFFPSGQ